MKKLKEKQHGSTAIARFEVRPHQVRVALDLSTWVAYVLAFVLLYRAQGPEVTALCLLPVAVAGWLFGMRAGLLAGLLSFPLNTLLLDLVGEPGWDTMIRHGAPGSAAAVLIGVVVGRLHDLGERVKRELAERQRVEEEREHLFEIERRRTAELEALRQASLHLTSSLELQSLLEAILEQALKLVAADGAHVFLYDGERLTFGAALWASGRQQEPYAEPRPDGLTYTVARSGKRVVVPDVDNHPLFRDWQWGGAIVGLPLRIGDQVRGVMNVSFEPPHEFDEDELRVLELLADQAAAAMENARLYAAEQIRRQELDVLYGLSRRLVAIVEMEAVLGNIARHVVETVNVTFARIVTLEDGTFVCRTAHPVRLLERDLGVGQPDQEPAWPYYQRALAQAEPQILLQDDQELGAAERRALFLDLAQSVCLAPLRAGDEAVGLLVLGEARTVTREPIGADKLRLIASISDQAASALHRARLYEELEEAYVQTVVALANAMDARDTYTNKHSQQLAEWAVATARELDCNEDEIETIRWAALLHDIGKIGVPDSILRKPGPLTDKERAVIERHPEIGERIVAPVKRLAHVAPIIRAHQERWDGGGYPDGAAGEDIPLAARVLTVVDAYGAMTDERVYRKARSHAEAMTELQRCAGTQFDPQVVEAFLRVMGNDERRVMNEEHRWPAHES
ncbi:MAG: HD domain-containing phosphohydrolase [Anaerolineae bacterium]